MYIVDEFTVGFLEKSNRWLWKESCVTYYWCDKARKHMCVTDRHDMALAVKVPLNPSTTNQPTVGFKLIKTFINVLLDSATENADQYQDARTCSLILLYTIFKISPWSRTTG